MGHFYRLLRLLIFELTFIFLYIVVGGVALLVSFISRALDSSLNLPCRYTTTSSHSAMKSNISGVDHGLWQPHSTIWPVTFHSLIVPYFCLVSLLAISWSGHLRLDESSEEFLRYPSGTTCSVLFHVRCCKLYFSFAGEDDLMHVDVGSYLIGLLIAECEFSIG